MLRTNHVDSQRPASGSSVLPRRLCADVILVLALNAGKDFLLAEVGVFWVLVRVLACGGLAVLVWLVTSGQLQTKRMTEVRYPVCQRRWYLPEPHDSGPWWECHQYCCSCGTQDCSRLYIDCRPLGKFIVVLIPSVRLMARQSHSFHTFLAIVVQVVDFHYLRELESTLSSRKLRLSRVMAGQESVLRSPLPSPLVPLGCSLPPR